MQNFNDFLQTLDQTKLVESGTANVDANKDPAYNASTISTSISLDLLRQYHEWLMKQLS